MLTALHVQHLSTKTNGVVSTLRYSTANSAFYWGYISTTLEVTPKYQLTFYLNSCRAPLRVALAARADREDSRAHHVRADGGCLISHSRHPADCSGV